MQTLSRDEDAVNGIEWKNINVNLEKIELSKIERRLFCIVFFGIIDNRLT